MMCVTIYTNGQIMLHAKVRHQLNIKAGDSLAFFINENSEHKEIIMCKTTSVDTVLKAWSFFGQNAQASETVYEDNTHELIYSE